jgi:glutathione peroxidase
LRRGTGRVAGCSKPTQVPSTRRDAVPSVYEFTADTLDGRKVSLGEFAGNVLLIVNTASHCGFTPQYEGLQQLHSSLAPRGFAVLGFPCNQFGKQEPGDAATIAAFCEQSYRVTFPLFAKIEVNGEGAHPLYRFLKEQCPGVLGSQPIKWNFTKFLVDRSGQPVSRHAPTTAPRALAEDIAALL